ncbi:ribonuclease domain-containing protein [Simplicispira psychrophila]|uniref:ribonuclease domain-containing protein n=1 Tax=Simplicispira psychrophila TaxID=80882 RepID=UPI0004854DA6|nr:ribonuclease [Simplicispira psychrophila]
MLKAPTASACKAGFACILSVAFVFAPALADAKSPPLFPALPVLDRPAPMALAQLPPQGRATYALIYRGGPFPHDKDGTVFGNRERLLPAQTRGYYREYTVGTPGARNRGARRIVCGGKPIAPSVCYYTADHYNSFREIAP